MLLVSVVIDLLPKLNLFQNWLKFNLAGKETPHGPGQGLGAGCSREGIGIADCCC